MSHPMHLPANIRLSFVGGGNMASAIVGGLRKRGLAAEQIQVLEPLESARAALLAQHGVQAQAEPSPSFAQAQVLVWAVKPQVFGAAAAALHGLAQGALHVSVMAGVRVASIAQATGAARIVRCMPNTPALVGRGITGLFANASAGPEDRALAEALIASTGDWLWLEHESQLDAVTALSGSGPAYVFYFLEAMQQAGTALGLSPEQARQLAVATFAGGAALAGAATEPLATLRERVTSKGGTTHAALTVLREAGVEQSFVAAMKAAAERSKELGQAS